MLPGGYGASVLELLSEKGIATPVARIGWPDQFIEHASTVEHLQRKIWVDGNARRSPGARPFWPSLNPPA